MDNHDHHADNMAYLEQISRPPASAKKPEKKSGLLALLNWKVGAVLGGVILVIIILTSVLGAVSKPEREDYDLLIQSWYRATFMNKTLDQYTNKLKSSDLRALSMSLRGVLQELTYNDEQLLLNEYSIDVDDYKKDERSIDEVNAVNAYTLNLENGRLNGVLDRTFVRETSMQVAYLISYQSECAARTKIWNVKDVALKTELNLVNIRDQFEAYKDLSN